MVYLRPGSRIARQVPESVLGWLPTAELLIEESGFRRWLRKQGRIAGTHSKGRPPRTDAIDLTRALVAQGRWKASDKPGELYNLLNERGRLQIPVGRSTANRIAHELGYRRRAKSIQSNPKGKTRSK